MCEGILIFGGTTEGRELAEYCAAKGIKALSSVTTELGAELLPNSAPVTVGRLDRDQMAALIGSGYTLIIDATHPYAEEASANIKAACARVGAGYYRVIREGSAPGYGEVVTDTEELVRRLNAFSGTILSTLGSKEAAALTKVSGYSDRVWLRILPNSDNIEYCVSLGFDRARIIAEKGPFTIEQNISHIKKSGAAILVTKNSGAAGGYPEKAASACECGIALITIGRPREDGISAEEMKAVIDKENSNGQ